MKNITFIIVNRGGTNIDFIIKKYKKFYPNAQYIVITQDDNKQFCRGQLFNIAYNYALNDYLCLCDNDMFFDTYIDFILEYEKLNCVAIQPFNSITQVKIDKENFIIKSKRILDKNSKGGITFISKEKFEQINGYSNLYVGWGCEDGEMNNRCKGIKNLKNTVYHISHPSRNSMSKYNKNHIHFKLNLEAINAKKDNSLDGYKNTTCEITKNEIINDVQYLNVKNIYVDDTFIYKSFIDAHYKD